VAWTTRKDNATRLHLFALGYNLANFLRQHQLPKPIKTWTLTTLREKLVRIGVSRLGNPSEGMFAEAHDPGEQELRGGGGGEGGGEGSNHGPLGGTPPVSPS
jgi:hypothetical protein